MLQVLHEDNHVLGVVKPAGLLVQGDRTGDPTLLEAARAYLKQKYEKPGNVYVGLVHRLDRPVSGVVVLARTSKAAARLSREFRERRVRKVYLAVVLGAPPAAAGILRAEIAAAPDAAGVSLAAVARFPGSRRAELVYTVVGRSAGRCLLRVEPRTGRRHQIRAQLALAGCPVVGDVKYGAPERLPDRSVALHAWRLEVAHPVSREAVILQSPPSTSWPWEEMPAWEDGT
ncbi:MAG: RNA pseudouridine synthase [Candidatus Krumholzibacteriia bacterium]